jgi:hypothetical protein
LRAELLTPFGVDFERVQIKRQTSNLKLLKGGEADAARAGS